MEAARIYLEEQSKFPEFKDIQRTVDWYRQSTKIVSKKLEEIGWSWYEYHRYQPDAKESKELKRLQSKIARSVMN